MRDATFILCAVTVAMLPVVLIRRWPHIGMLVSVIFGWFVIHQQNMAYEDEWSEPVDAVFAGLWALGGWLFMLAWCLPIYLYAMLRALRAHRAMESAAALKN